MKSSVDLRSETGDPSTTIVDAQGIGRCLAGVGITGAPDVWGITFQNGTHGVEGGILLAGQGGTGGGHNVRYQNCVFRNGSAPLGGAVVIRTGQGAAPTFTLCVFESNRATGSDGGAIWSRGVGSVESCQFLQNEAARHGGAFYSTGGGDLYGSSIVSCRFTENSGVSGGAASLNEYDIVQHCTFLDNEASGDGGALYLSFIQPDKDNFGNYPGNVFARNTAGSEGGAAYFSGGVDNVFLNNNTFVANGAPSGGHFWTSGNPVVRSCIFAFATAGGAGAGTETVSPTCTDVFGNVGGDFTLRQGSPCLPPLPTGCQVRIGALGEGCSPVSVESESWGSIKSAYR